MVILIAEDDAGHYQLIKKNLWLSCVNNEIVQFKDGQEVLDFLFRKGSGAKRLENVRYMLLLDIQMPKVDGREVLRQLKEDKELRKMPMIMLTTTNEASEIDYCYDLGCSFYMAKPVNYQDFMKAVENLGKYLSLKCIKLPAINNQEN